MLSSELPASSPHPPAVFAADSQARAHWRLRVRVVLILTVALVVLAGVVMRTGSRARRAPVAARDMSVRDTTLRALPLYLYRTHAPPCAMLFFFGNDVGFWSAHEALAERLADDGIAVVGFDVKRWMDDLPDDGVDRVGSFATGVESIVRRARHELGADDVPLVLGGHSIGAEMAIWTAAHDTFPQLVGVLAMSPGERGHLRVTLTDLAEREPTEPGSFANADQVRQLPAGVRVALVRGANDALARADAALVRAGGPRLQRYVIPLAGHSLKRLVLAGPIISHAMTFLLDHQHVP